MNWILVSLLSIPGVLMGLLSVRGHTRGIEPYLWIVLAVFATVVIARTAGERFFFHGFGVGIAWGVLNGLVAAAFFSVYARHNPETLERMGEGFAASSPRLMFLVSGPAIGLVTGLVLGTLCWGASHWIRPASPLVG
ncbi:MAG: hypothetical protein ACE5HP_11490 [Gemmatimonadota bacterium]